MQLRRLVNWLNLSTPAGLLLAGAGGGRLRPTPDGYYLATGYRWRFPIAGAFTVGDVVLTAGRRRTADPYSPLTPAVWGHEIKHSNQYAWCGGITFLPAYLLAAGYSIAVSGDHASYNPFETRAGLAAGGYVKAPRRRPRSQRA